MEVLFLFFFASMLWRNEIQMVILGKMGAEKRFSFKRVNARASTRIWAHNVRRLACRPSQDALFKTQIHLTRVQSALWANYLLFSFQHSLLFSDTYYTWVLSAFIDAKGKGCCRRTASCPGPTWLLNIYNLLFMLTESQELKKSS